LRTIILKETGVSGTKPLAASGESFMFAAQTEER
jgi:hypothetical protein